MNTLIKQANNRLLGNLYLHLISEYFYIFLQNNNLLNYLDGEYSADSYDGITQELINLHQQPFLQHFITAPISPASCTLETPYFSLSNKINHNLIDLDIILDIILEINLTDDFLKPLASIVLNALSNILDILYLHDAKFYKLCLSRTMVRLSMRPNIYWPQITTSHFQSISN